MSRLRAGLNKLEASKRGLTNAYVQDSTGAWIPKDSVAATGLVPLALTGKSTSAKTKVALSIAAAAIRDEAHTAAEKALKTLAMVIEDEHFRQQERMLDLGEEMPDKIIMTTNQPCKLTVLYENGQYRKLPFIGGEVFVANGAGLSKSGRKIVYAKPELEIRSEEHGNVTRIEVSIEKEGELFETKKQFKTTEEGAEQATRIKNAINEKKLAKQSKQDAAKERMEKDEVFGSW